jgi:hypothetical protein
VLLLAGWHALRRAFFFGLPQTLLMSSSASWGLRSLLGSALAAGSSGLASSGTRSALGSELAAGVSGFGSPALGSALGSDAPLYVGKKLGSALGSALAAGVSGFVSAAGVGGMMAMSGKRASNKQTRWLHLWPLTGRLREANSDSTSMSDILWKT